MNNTYTITIFDPVRNQTFDVSDRLLELTINEKLDRDVTTFSLKSKDIYNTHLWNHVQVKKNGSLFLTGIILNQQDSDGGIKDYKVTSFECEDWGHLLTKRLINKTYLSTDAFQGKPDLILKDILLKVPEITTNNVRTCSTIIDKYRLSYVSTKEAIDGVFDMLSDDWHYYIDKNKDFHFFSGYESVGTTFTIDNIAVKTLKVEYSGQEHCNKVYIIGRKQESPNTIEQFFTGDEQQRYFTLAYEPNSTNVYVDGAEKDSSLVSNDNGSRDFLIDKERKVVYIPEYKTPFTGTIKVTYKPTVQFIDMYENKLDQKKFGNMEKAVKNSNITDKYSARQYGTAEVKKTSTTKRKITFRSREIVEIGQKVIVNIRTYKNNELYWDVVGSFLVTSVKRVITPEDEIITFELLEI